MKSSNYFNSRLEQRMHKAHEEATIPVHKINRAINQSKKRLKKEVKRLLKNMEGTAPHERIKWLNERISAEEYEEALTLFNTSTDPVVRDKMRRKIVSNAAVGRIKVKTALIQAIEREGLWVIDKQLALTKQHLSSTFIDTMNDFGFSKIPQRLVDEVLQQKWLGSNYSERIWKNQNAISKKLEQELINGFISGKSNEQIAREIDHYTDVGKHASNRLVRTETSYIINSADLQDSIRRGIKAKKFEAHLDSRTSKICREHNQRIVRIEEIEIGKNAPPMHPYCRSVMSDVLQGWDYDSEDELEAMINEAENFENNTKNDYNINIEIDEFTPCLRKNSDNSIVETSFKEMEERYTPNGFEFDWTKVSKEAKVFELRAENDDRIQGLIAMTYDDTNKAVFVNLVESANHNRFGNEYNGVGGHLFAEAVKNSIEKYGDGVVFFDSKTSLINHYKKELGAVQLGKSNRMILHGESSIKLFERYYGKVK